MAETKEQDVILRYRIEGDADVEKLRQKNTELFKSIEANQQAVNSLRAANKELSKDYAANSTEIATNKQKIAELTAVNKTYNAELNNNIKTIASGNGSLQAQRAELSRLTAEYIKLSETERNQTEAGLAMQQQIKSLSDSLKEQEKAIGDTRRNVGNYTDSIIEAGDKLGINTSYVTQAREAYKAYSVGAQAAGKSTNILKFALDLLAKNPIIAILGVIIGLFMAVKAAMQKNAESFDSLKIAIAPVTKLFDFLMSVLGDLVAVIIGGFARAIEYISELFGGAEQSTKKYIAALKELDDVEDIWVNKRIKDKKLQEDINKLMEKANDRRLTAKERIEALTKANELEKKIATESAELQLRQNSAIETTLKSKYNLKNKLINDDLTISKEAIDKLSEEDKKQLEDSITQLIDYQNKKSEIDAGSVKKLSTLQNSITAEQKEQSDKRLKIEQDNAKLRTELVEKLQSETIKLMKDGKEKEFATLQASYQKELATIAGQSQLANDLRKKLSENLLKEQQAITDKYTDEAIQKTIEVETQKIQLRLDAIKEGSAEELSLRQQLLNQQEEAELIAAEKAGISKQLVYDKYNALRAETDKQFADEQRAKAAEQLSIENQNRILELQLSGESTLAEEVNQKQKQIDALQQLDGESAAEFKNRQLTLSAELLELKNQQIETEIAAQQAQIESVRNVANAFSDILSIIGANEGAAAQFAKALALVQIGLDTATAISKGVAASSGVPFPGNLLAISTTIAAVTANILKAKQLLSGAGKEPATPKYKKAAVGAVVAGSQSNIDSVPFLLSPQERVVNSNSGVMFAPLLSAINQIGGGIPLAGSGSAEGEAFLTRSFAAALQLMPSPVVGVDEITRVTNRVSVYESIAKS